MGLNKSRGNMYDFVSHTWNTTKGKCSHSCSYCSIKSIAERFNSPQKDARFDNKELKTNLGVNNFIFVGSSNDMFSKEIPEEWILKTFEYCKKFDNSYLFQTKNPKRFLDFVETGLLPDKTVLCSTIESNRFYFDAMQNSPRPEHRANALSKIKGIDIYITVEPIMDFDLTEFVKILKSTNAKQINIGADSSKIADRNLIEPSKGKILQLISELEKFTVVKQKTNLKRLLI